MFVPLLFLSLFFGFSVIKNRNRNDVTLENSSRHGILQSRALHESNFNPYTPNSFNTKYPDTKSKRQSPPLTKQKQTKKTKQKNTHTHTHTHSLSLSLCSNSSLVYSFEVVGHQTTILHVRTLRLLDGI